MYSNYFYSPSGENACRRGTMRLDRRPDWGDRRLMDKSAGTIRVGIGGWDFDPWRGTFYPPGLAKAKQLEQASRQLTAIEINATYYRTQSPALFERWAKTVPDGFKFAVKASRFCTTRRILAEGAESVERFCGQGLTALGDRLGPILWQFMATKKFDAEDFGAFLKM